MDDEEYAEYRMTEEYRVEVTTPFEDTLEFDNMMDPDSYDYDAYGEPDEPVEGDYVITDEGVGIVGEGFISDAVEWDDISEAIRADMEASNFYPDVWIISDHGNAHRTSINA